LRIRRTSSEGGIVRTSRRWASTLLSGSLLFLTPSGTIADDENGDSVALVVRECDDDTRCTEADCSEDAVDRSCFATGIYYGSRTDCVFSLEPREAYCSNVDGSRERMDFRECVGLDEMPCDGTPTCEWCRTTACADGSTCGEKVPGICGEDGPACLDCLPHGCDTGECGDGGPGLCEDDTPCFHPQEDRLRWRHPTGKDVISSPIIASCNAPLDPFYPDASSFFACSGSSCPNRAPGLNPRPVDNHCIFIGSYDKHLYVLDEEPAKRPTEAEAPFASCLASIKSSGDGEIWRNPAAPECIGGSCDVLFASKSDGSPSYLDKVRRYPVPPTGTLANCDDPDNFLTCDLELAHGDDWRVEAERTGEGNLQIRGGLLIPKNDDGTEFQVSCGDGKCSLPDDKSRLLILGSSRGYRMVKLDVDLSALSSSPSPAWDEIEWASVLPPVEFVERYGLQKPKAGTSGPDLYWGYGGSGGAASGVSRFTIPAVPTSDHPTSWEFGRNNPSGEPPGTLNGCEDGDNDSQFGETTGVQYHRTTAVATQTGDAVFITNRDGTSSRDLGSSVVALDGATGDLEACGYETDGGGIVAAPAHASVRCADLPSGSRPCCTDVPFQPDKRVDRIILATKSQQVRVFDYCEQTLHEIEDSGGGAVITDDDLSLAPAGPTIVFDELRAQPAVAAELGTFYIRDNHPGGEKFFAFDLFDPDRGLLWYYDASVDHDNSAYCELYLTSGAEAEDCYPSPIPIAVDIDLTSPVELYPADDCGCIDETSVWLGVGAHHPTAANLDTLADTNYASSAVSSTHVLMQDGVGSIEFHNETTDQKELWTCGSFFCGDYVDASNLQEGANEIVLTRWNKFGKRGSTRITLTYEPTNGCPACS
jgi:hypothetical protein